MAFKNNPFALILFSRLFLTASVLTTVNANEIEVANGPESIICGTGQKQSPINLVRITAVALPTHRSLTRNYRPAPATLRNRVEDIAVEWRGGDAGGIMINESQYNVQQCHWHIPAEHTINGQRFDMELHIVHANSEGKLAVIGVLYRFGLPDPFLTQITPLLRFVGEPEQEASAGIINPLSTSFDTSKYYRYNGSLTVPPCSENVTWTVIDRVNTVSRMQVTALQHAVEAGPDGNARPLQPLNGRPIYFYS